MFGRHALHRFAAEHGEASDIGAHGIRPAGTGDGLKPPARAGAAGIIHQHIHAPVMLHHGFKNADGMGLILDRTLHQQHLGAGGFAIKFNGFGTRAILLEGQAKVIASCGGHARGGRTNAAPRTGDDH